MYCIVYIPTLHAFGSLLLTHTLLVYRHTYMTFPPPDSYLVYEKKGTHFSCRDLYPILTNLPPLRLYIPILYQESNLPPLRLCIPILDQESNLPPLRLYIPILDQEKNLPLLRCGCIFLQI